MGLFRSRGKKMREKASAELVQEQITTVEAPADAALHAVTPSASAEPVQEQITTVEAPADAARRAVTAEARPNPDQPGWGRTLGQEIGRRREDRAGQV